MQAEIKADSQTSGLERQLEYNCRALVVNSNRNSAVPLNDTTWR